MTTVRPASSSDAPSVAAVGRVAFVQQYEGLMDPVHYNLAADRWYSDETIEESIRRCEQDPDALFLVAEREGAVVGFLHFDETGPEPELHRIYLAAGERGQGTGSLLMDALHARLPPGAEYVLAVIEGNDGAIRFYRKHGLEIDRRVSGKNYYREVAGLDLPEQADDFTCVLMRYRK